MSLIQNTTETITFDVADLGAVTGVEIKLYNVNGKVTKLKWKYPTTTGWEVLAVNGTEYTATLTKEMTDALSTQVLGIEIAWYVGAVREAVQGEYDQLISKAS